MRLLSLLKKVSFSVKKENKAARWQTGGRSLFKHGPLPNALSGPTQSRTDRGSRDNAPRGPAHVDTNRGLPPNVPREPSHPVLMAERPLKVSRGPLGPGADQPKTYTPSVHLENNLLAKPAPLPSSKRQTPPTEMSLRPTFESTASNGTNSITDLTGENTLTTSSQTKIQDPVGIQTAPAGTETRRSSEKQSPRGHQTIDDLLQGVQCRMPIQQNPFLIDQRSEDPHQGEVSATTDLLPTGQGAPSIDQEPRSVHRDHHGTGEGDHDSVDLSSKQFKIRTQKSVASISSLRSDPIMPPDVDENKLLQRSNQEAEDHKIKCKHLEAIISQLKKEHGRKIRKKDDELERKVKAFAKERENACKRFNTLQVETTELRRRQKSVPNPENQQTQSLEVYNLRHEVDRLNDLLKSEKSFKPRERRDLEESFKREKDVLQQESVRLSRHIQWQKKTWAREKKELEESLQSSKGASEKQRGPQNHADAQEELAWTQERQRLRRSLERQDETLNEQYQTILRLKNRASDQQSLCQRLQGRVSDLEQKLRVPQTQIGEASTAENVNGLLGCSLIPGTPTVLEAGGEMASLQMDLVHLSNEKQALRAENTSLKDELAALKDSAHGRPKAPVSCIAHMDLSTGLPLNLLPIDYKAKQEEICQRPRPKQVAQRKPTSIDRRMPHTHTVEYRPPLARNQKTDQGSLRSALGLPTRSRRPMLLKEVRIPSSDVQPESSTEDTSSQETTVKETRLDGNDRRRSQGDDRSIADSEDSQSDNTSPVRDASKASAPRDNRNCGVYDLLQEQLSLPTLMPRVVDNELAFSERKKDRHGRDVRNQPSFKIRKVPRGRWNQ